MAVEFKEFKVLETSFTSIKLYYKTSEPISELYWYLNGVGTKKTLSSGTTEGTLLITIDNELHGQQLVFQLMVIDDEVNVYSHTIVTKTLLGCYRVDLDTVDIDNKYISMNLYNENLSDIVLSLSIECPEVYNGVNVMHDTVITKKITGVTGNYRWNLTDEELHSILSTMRYCGSAKIILYETSYNAGGTWKLFTSAAIGTITLTESNLCPVIEEIITIRDELTSNIISMPEYLIQNVSTLNISIPSSNIKLHSSAELISVNWLVHTNNNGASLEKINYTNQETFVKEFGKTTFIKEGIFSVTFKATDSRGFSGSMTKQYKILPYHKPVIYAEIVRPLNSGGAISINYKASVSRLNINNISYNYATSCRYGYSVMPDGGLPVSNNYMSYNNSDSANGIDTELSYNSDYWITVDPKLNYKFVFTIEDRVDKNGIYIDLIDGTPIMRMLTNGQISIGKPVDTFDTTTLLFINSDISGVDIEGNDRKVFDTISNLITISSVQPENQIIGGIWLESDGS